MYIDLLRAFFTTHPLAEFSRSPFVYIHLPSPPHHRLKAQLEFPVQLASFYHILAFETL